jgi:hypothetical protein
VGARWDIFGRVVDNFGDAGVCWRLARELAAEHSLDVTLWQDDLAPLARIVPGLDPTIEVQRAMGVTVRRWTEPLASPHPPTSSSKRSAADCPSATSRRWLARQPHPPGSSSNT